MRLTAHAQTAGTHCGHTLNGCSGLRSYGTYQTHDTAYCLRYLRDDRDALRAQLAEAQAQVQTARDALVECRDELDAYSQNEYPSDHPVHVRYRQRDYAANPARIALALIQPTDPRPDAAKEE